VALPAAYQTGLALGRDVAVASLGVGGRFSVTLLTDDEVTNLYESEQWVSVGGSGGLSWDEALLVMAHSEHGDSRNPALRVVSLDGSAVAGLWDGPGPGLQPRGPVTG
jgi:hypothetical protein